MKPTLYYHPLASYCWKVLVALYENGTDFERRVIDLGDDALAIAEDRELAQGPQRAELGALRVVAESSIIVEHLDRRHPGPRPLVPTDPDASLEVRLWDRILDLHVHTPMGEIVLDRLRDAKADTSRARSTITTAYGMIDARLAASRWLGGEDFTLADCSAAPALFYAATLEAFAPEHTRLAAYFERLVARPSVARTLEEAKPSFVHYPFASAIPARFR